MEPNKKSVEMTIGQMFSKLAQQAEKWGEDEKRKFREAWIAGAKRMNQAALRKKLD